jgi:hypothetical protein
MGRKAESKMLDGSRFRDLTFDPNGTGSTRAEAAAMHGKIHTAIQRQAGAKQYQAEVRTLETFDGLVAEVDNGH